MYRRKGKCRKKWGTRVKHKTSSTIFAMALLQFTGCQAPLDHIDSSGESLSVKSVGDPSALGCRMELAEAGLGGVVVRTTFRNDTAEPIRFLSWGTPWDELADAFEILDSSTQDPLEQVEPTWRMGIVPPDSAYIELGPGKSVSSLYSVSENYPVSGKGAVVMMRAEGVTGVADGVEYEYMPDCGAIELSPSDSPVGTTAQALSVHSNCSSSQKEKIRGVIKMANNVTAGALRMSIQGWSSPASPAIKSMNKRWFGVTTPSNTGDGLGWAWFDIATSDATVRCGGDACDSSVNGKVVDVVVADRLYLCPAAWKMPIFAMNSRSVVETLIHETAHYEDSTFGDIVDWNNPSCSFNGGNKCYDYPNSLHLATHCFLCARRNTDNYVGFAVEAYMVPLLATSIL